MLTQPINQKWKAQLEQEWAGMQAQPDHVHNQELHLQIVSTWRQLSPKMWRRLQYEGMGGLLARVLQQRMWAERDRLIEQGTPVTDAREQAEREHLMLEPESEMPADQPELTPAL